MANVKIQHSLSINDLKLKPYPHETNTYFVVTPAVKAGAAKDPFAVKLSSVHQLKKKFSERK